MHNQGHRRLRKEVYDIPAKSPSNGDINIVRKAAHVSALSPHMNSIITRAESNIPTNMTGKFN